MKALPPIDAYPRFSKAPAPPVAEPLPSPRTAEVVMGEIEQWAERLLGERARAIKLLLAELRVKI